MCRLPAKLDGEIVNFGSPSFKMSANEANGIAKELIRLGLGKRTAANVLSNNAAWSSNDDGLLLPATRGDDAKIPC